MRSVLVTGASGFIGRRLCERLQVDGISVCALARQPTKGPWQRFLACDLAHATPSKDALKGVDCVFHLAGKAHALRENKAEEKTYQKINVAGTYRLLESATQAGVRCFILFSSVHVLEKKERATPYSRSKQAAEVAVLANRTIPHISILRPAMVYGVGVKGNLPKMITAIRKGWFPPLPEVGNRRSMVHIDDVVEAALLLASSPKANRKACTIADYEGYSSRQIQTWIQLALGRSMPTWAIPQFVLRWAGWFGDGIGHLQGRRFLFDSAALDKLLGDAFYPPDPLLQELGFQHRHHLREVLPDIVNSMDT